MLRPIVGVIIQILSTVQGIMGVSHHREVGSSSLHRLHASLDEAETPRGFAPMSKVYELLVGAQGTKCQGRIGHVT